MPKRSRQKEKQQEASMGKMGERVFSPDNAPDRSRKSSRPLRRLILKVAICVLVFVACIFLALIIGDANYNATLIGWTPLLVFATLILLALIYEQIAVRSLEYVQTSDVTCCVRGQKIPFAICFENKGPFLLLNVQIELFVSDINGNIAQTATTSLTMDPHSTLEVPFNVPFEHIGMFTAGLKQITIVDFLGLFERRIEVNQEGHICVLPKVPELSSMRFSEDSDVENFKMLKTALADSLDYAYVRDYEPGDPLKTIHWKLSARTDHYMTRLFEKTISPGVIVFADFFSPRQDADESMELRDSVVESALAIAEFARLQGLDIEIRYTDRFGEDRVLEKWDESSVVELVGSMPMATADKEIRECAMKHIQKAANLMQSQNNLVVCSANVADDMVGCLISAKKLRKTPFLVSSVPHRLYDRDLDRYIERLSALDGYAIGYQTITSSKELEGRDL